MDSRQGKRLITAALAICLLAGAALAHAGLGPATAARDWCKKKTLHYLQKRGYEPYNWTATTYIEDNNYVTEGEWRVDVDTIKVQCTSKKDLRKITGKYKILNVEILDEDEPDKPKKK